MIWANLSCARNARIRASFSVALALACLLATPHRATAENASSTASTASHDSVTGAILHAQHMRSLFRSEHGNQPTPLVIPKMEIDRDPNGTVATYQPGGPTLTSRNAFFADLGTNGRTCFTCHQPAEGWTISATGARARFERSLGSDPLFRLFDGATCPSDDLSSLDAQLAAYSLLINKGLIRIGLPMPKAPQFEIDELEHRPHQHHHRHRFSLSPALALHQSRLSEHHHVGWPRAQSCEPGGRCDSHPCTGGECAVKNADGTDRRLRERNLHGAEL